MATKKWKQVQVHVRSADMSRDKVSAAARVCADAMEKNEDFDHVARTLKNHFDRAYPEVSWQCVVGQTRKFCGYVTHQPGYFIYFQIGNMTVLLFSQNIS